jgi:hypothetical protein
MIPVTYLFRAGVLALLIALGYMGYAHVKAIGYKEAEAKYELIIKDYEENVAKKINAIEILAVNLSKDSKQTRAQLSGDIDKIVEGQKGKSLTIIKDGECNPNQTFKDGFVSMNQRANQSLKGSKQLKLSQSYFFQFFYTVVQLSKTTMKSL